MPTALTVRQIENLKHGPKRQYVHTGMESLYVIVQPAPSKHKSWALIFRRPGGKLAKIVLGSVDLFTEIKGDPVVGMPLTLKAAHQLTAKMMRERKLGRDLIADHKARKLHRQKAQELLYPVMLHRYVEEHAKNHRKWRPMVKRLGLDYPAGEPTPNGLAMRWTDKSVTEITTDDICAVLEEAQRNGIPGMRTKVKGRSMHRGRDLHISLSGFFRWLTEPPRRFISSNPVHGAWKTPKLKARDRVLSEAEIVRFWKACDLIAVPYGAVFKLLLLLGCRLAEVARLRFDELIGDSIQLPGTRTKNGLPHSVPLPMLAVEILASVPRIEGSPYVFTGNGRAPVASFARVKRKLDAAMGGGVWRIHDLRRTFVTHMAELGYSRDLIELLVNHVSGSRSGVAGVYNRSKLLPQRKDALAHWAQHVQGLVSGYGLS